VIVAYQNQVVMQETLDGALAELFGGVATRRRPEAGPAVPAAATGGPASRDSGLAPLLDEARRRYQAALDAQRNIDWARYGEEMRRLGEILERVGSER
jgi:uncharacterized protein